MAEYTNEDLGVRFTLPDRPSVGQQLRYKGRVYATGFYSDDVYIRTWMGFLALFQEWECELVPDPKTLDLENETNPAVTDVMMWAGNTTARHMNTLEAEAVPKNS